ncbi:MAG: hypothetical protein ABID45_03685 [Patescibacteria group bacterium]
MGIINAGAFYFNKSQEIPEFYMKITNLNVETSLTTATLRWDTEGPGIPPCYHIEWNELPNYSIRGGVDIEYPKNEYTVSNLKQNQQYDFMVAPCITWKPGGSLSWYSQGKERKTAMTQTSSEIIIDGKLLNIIKEKNQQTYASDEYGFKFKYPDSWSLTENKENNYNFPVVSAVSPETQVAFDNKKVLYANDISLYYYPSVAEEPENQINNLGATNLQNLIEKNPMITNIGPIMIGNIKASEVIWGGQGSYYTILIEHNSHLYKILFGNIDNKSKLNEVEKQIISTFEFIK